eukprot:914870-Pelagomonas_calceolata.AAC.1
MYAHTQALTHTNTLAHLVQKDGSKLKQKHLENAVRGCTSTNTMQTHRRDCNLIDGHHGFSQAEDVLQGNKGLSSEGQAADGLSRQQQGNNANNQAGPDHLIILVGRIR